MTDEPQKVNTSIDENAWVSDPVRRKLRNEFSTDPLQVANLDEVFPGFADGKPILWSAVLRTARPGAAEEVRIEGTDWRLHIMVDEPYDVPAFADDGDRDDLSVGPPVAIVSVLTGETRLVAARGRATACGTGSSIREIAMPLTPTRSPDYMRQSRTS